MLGIDIELYISANLNVAILGDTPQDTQVHSRKFNICLSFFEMQLMSGTEISRQFKTSLPQLKYFRTFIKLEERVPMRNKIDISLAFLFDPSLCVTYYKTCHS